MSCKQAYNAFDEFWACLTNAFDGVINVDFIVIDQLIHHVHKRTEQARAVHSVPTSTHTHTHTHIPILHIWTLYRLCSAQRSEQNKVNFCCCCCSCRPMYCYCECSVNQSSVGCHELSQINQSIIGMMNHTR